MGSSRSRTAETTSDALATVSRSMPPPSTRSTVMRRVAPECSTSTTSRPCSPRRGSINPRTRSPADISRTSLLALCPQQKTWANAHAPPPPVLTRCPPVERNSRQSIAAQVRLRRAAARPVSELRGAPGRFGGHEEPVAGGQRPGRVLLDPARPRQRGAADATELERAEVGHAHGEVGLGAGPSALGTVGTADQLVAARVVRLERVGHLEHEPPRWRIAPAAQRAGDVDQ